MCNFCGNSSCSCGSITVFPPGKNETPITYLPTSTATGQVSGNAGHTIKTNVLVSSLPGNMITIEVDGLFAGESLIDHTWQEMYDLSIIDGFAANQRYRITDRGDQGIIVKAMTVNQLDINALYIADYTGTGQIDDGQSYYRYEDCKYHLYDIELTTDWLSERVDTLQNTVYMSKYTTDTFPHGYLYINTNNIIGSVGIDPTNTVITNSTLKDCEIGSGNTILTCNFEYSSISNNNTIYTTSAVYTTIGNDSFFQDVKIIISASFEDNASISGSVIYKTYNSKHMDMTSLVGAQGSNTVDTSILKPTDPTDNYQGFFSDGIHSNGTIVIDDLTTGVVIPPESIWGRIKIDADGNLDKLILSDLIYKPTEFIVIEAAPNRTVTINDYSTIDPGLLTYNTVDIYFAIPSTRTNIILTSPTPIVVPTDYGTDTIGFAVFKRSWLNSRNVYQLCYVSSEGGGGSSIVGTPKYLAEFNSLGNNVEDSPIRNASGSYTDIRIEGQDTSYNAITLSNGGSGEVFYAVNSHLFAITHPTLGNIAYDYYTYGYRSLKQAGGEYLFSDSGSNLMYHAPKQLTKTSTPSSYGGFYPSTSNCPSFDESLLNNIGSNNYTLRTYPGLVNSFGDILITSHIIPDYETPQDSNKLRIMSTIVRFSNTTSTPFSFVIGNAYKIDTYETGDNFSNIANVQSGVVNTTGCIFIATGTTPTDWTNSSTIATVATEIEDNSLFIYNEASNQAVVFDTNSNVNTIDSYDFRFEGTTTFQVLNTDNGIATDTGDVWNLGAATVGVPVPDYKVRVIINGQAFDLSAEIVV